MADRSVRLILKAEVADFKRQMAEAAAATDKIPASAAKAETALGQMVQSARLNRESWDRAGQTMTAFGTATLAGLALAGRAAMNWESQWTGVLKTVNGTDAELGALEDSLREMARTLPASHQEIAAVAEAAGQLGVQTSNVAAFTRVMIDLGETTNLSADEAATALAQLMNVMQTSANDVDNLGAAVVALGNNGASTERDIVLMAQRIAGAGKIVGLTEGEVLGLANALSSVGIDVEAGGTAISKIMTDMAKAVSTGSDDLAKFASVAGMSAEEFSAAFGDDPASAIASFVEGLGRINDSGGDVFTTLDDLGQSEIRVTRALLTMANSGDLLRESLALGNSAWADNTALAIEAGKRYDTAAAKLEIAKNGINDAAIAIGENLLPALAGAAEGVATLTGWLGGLPAPVQQATAGLAAIVGVTSLAAGGFLLLFPRVMDTITAFKTLPANVRGGMAAVGKVGGITAAATVGFTLLTAGVEAYGDANARAVLSVEETTRALLDMEDASTDLDSMFEGLGYGVDEVQSLSGAISRLTSPDAMDRLQDFSGGIRGIFGQGTTGADKVRDQFEAIGQALATMVDSGDAERAAEMFGQIGDQWEAQGGNLEDLERLMPAYTAALAGADNASTLAVESSTALGDATQYVGESTEDATAALDEWRTMVAESDADFISLTDAYQSVIDANTAWAQSSADATEKSTDSWEDYYDGASVSSTDFIAQLQAQVDAQAAWETNMTALTTKAREGMTAEMARAADEMISDLFDLGPEGAAQVALMASMTDAEFQTVVTLWGQRGTEATERFVAGVGAVAAPVIPLTADPASAYAVVDSFRRTVSGMTVYVNVAGQDVGFSTGRGNQTGRAFGGPVPGSSPSPRADNVLIRATAGEFVHQVPAVNYWGGGFMDAVNRMDKAAVASSIAGHAYGGQVGVPAIAYGGAVPSSAAPSLVGLAIEGTLDTAWGPAQIRGVVRAELADAGSRTPYRGG